MFLKFPGNERSKLVHKVDILQRISKKAPAPFKFKALSKLLGYSEKLSIHASDKCWVIVPLKKLNSSNKHTSTCLSLGLLIHMPFSTRSQNSSNTMALHLDYSMNRQPNGFIQNSKVTGKESKEESLNQSMTQNICSELSTTTANNYIYI